MSDGSREAAERHEAWEESERHADACETISALYPPDSEWPDTAAIGRELLLQALCANWRSLPTDIVLKLAELNKAHDDEVSRTL